MKTLEELLTAMNEAKAAAEAKPEDQALKTAFEEAKTAYDEAKLGADKPPAPGEPDESKLDQATKDYLAKLRKENASHRTKAKDLASKLKDETDRKNAILKAAGIEVEAERPEEKLKALSQQNSTMAFRNAILESAVQNGIPGTELDYYEFLVSKATGELEEGEELEDSKLAEIVAKVKKQAGKGGAANSTVAGGGGANAPAPSDGKNAQVTMEKFVKMSISEKSDLYVKNKDLYEQLLAEAKAKKKLVA